MWSKLFQGGLRYSLRVLFRCTLKPPDLLVKVGVKVAFYHARMWLLQLVFIKINKYNPYVV